MHVWQAGRRAEQIDRPSSINKWLYLIQSSGGSTFMRSLSACTASMCFVRPRRREIRPTWVSTTTPSACPNPLPRTTLAVFRPTPGNATNSDSCRGTLPECRSTSAREHPRIFLALDLKKPVVRMTLSICGWVARAIFSGVGQRPNRVGVTILTRLSVH